MARRKSKPVAEYVEKQKETETATKADGPAPEAPKEDIEEPIQEPASVSTELVGPPDTTARVEDALESVPGVMRGRDLREPNDGTEQDGSSGPNRWAGVVRDSAQKIRIDKETVRTQGCPYLRVLVSFPKDAKPSPEERQLLKDEGFSFDSESWGKELTGANVLLAKQVVNRIYKMRGDDFQLFLG